MAEEKSLDDLLVDEQEINEGVLVGLLDDYIRIGREEGNLYPKPKFESLNSKQKTALVLLAQHARYKLGLAETEWLPPAEISELSGVKRGTIHPAVRELNELNLVQTEDGDYRVPPPKLLAVREFIEGGE